MTRAQHQVEPAAVGRFMTAGGPTGLLVGRGTDGQPALLRMFRAQPTRITVIGGVWLGRLVVFRALALGARVLVRTMDPGRWQGLGEAATGSAERVVLVQGQPGPTPGYIGEPVLHVFDLDGARPADLGPTDAWQTTLTIGAQVTGAAAEALSGSDAAVVQRMWPQQAEYAAVVLGIDPEAAAPVADLPDDMVAVLRFGELSFVRLVPTSIERRMFGAPQR
ncbi:hypothetical protein [Virgisporangium aliadipatigenens]|nr:hypothetical protein [Virgisporangium aliadipatigenens]